MKEGISRLSFFSNDENRRLLIRFRDQLESSSLDYLPSPNVVRHLEIMVDAFIASGEDFDRSCELNIEWIGAKFIQEIRSFHGVSVDEKKDLILSIFTMAYRFLREYEFSLPRGYQLAPDLMSVESFITRNFSEFEGRTLSSLTYTQYLMPAKVLKELVNNPALAEFKEFHAVADRATKLKAEWNDEISGKLQKIEALSDKVDKLKAKYNFVALSKGFQDLLDQKRRDSARAFSAIFSLGFAMLLPVFAQLIFVLINIDKIEVHKSTLIYALPGVLTIEIILFYFFRVALAHHNSIKAQILQLDLRVSLCQFIESYAEYAKKIREDDKSALEKFEQLIFSGLVATEEDIPSTFDGIDQIGKLLSALKGKP